MIFKHKTTMLYLIIFVGASSDTLILDAKVNKNSVATDICIAEGRSTSQKMLCIDKETNNIYALNCQEKRFKRLVDAIGECQRHYNIQDLWPASHQKIEMHSVVDKERLDQLRRQEIQDHLEDLQSTCNKSGIEFTNYKNFFARVFCYRNSFGRKILYFKNKRPGRVISKKIWLI